jgi:phage I-like protein
MNTNTPNNNKPPASPTLCRALCAQTESAAFLSLCFVLPESEQLPDWLLILPAGQFVGRDQRSWINDNPQRVVQSFNAAGIDIPIDINHSTELKAPKGEPAPAQGFFTQLKVRDGEVWGKAEWNANGQTHLNNKESRYYSPAFLHDKDGHIFSITSVGLTNKPNLRVPALNSQQGNQAMLPDEIRKALGLPEGADIPAAITAIQGLKSDKKTALNAAKQAPSLEQYVPRNEHTAALNRAQQAETKLAAQVTAAFDADVDSVLDDAVKVGKVLPVNKDFYKSQCQDQTGLDKLKAFIDGQPAQAEKSNLDNKPPADNQTALNAEEANVLEKLGMNTEDGKKRFQAIKQQESAS